MPWTEADIEKLKAAIVARNGARVITFSDQTITFDSIADMLKLLATMGADVAATTGGSRTRFAATSKGV
jgi:hypothetical protein